MKKGLKITLIVLGVLVGIVALNILMEESKDTYLGGDTPLQIKQI